ncbi:MAG: DUF2156 domain-containing protein [Spirochaetales bacterium]|nr:DUF2156 domain-containing protein [Spirochaetales bacterium]
MIIPNYPITAPISLDMRSELHPLLYNLNSGISEYTFSGLYLFRDKYNYNLSRLDNGDIVIFGTEDGKSFCMLPFGFPDKKTSKELVNKQIYFKGISEQDTEKYRISLEKAGFCILEDRDNFDYLYERSNLVHLTGRKFHKKRNMVNAFISNYNYEEKYITHKNVKDALQVLQKWKENRIKLGLSTADYESANEALEKMDLLELTGCITYVDRVPAAYSLGEPINRGKSFVVQFEKAIGDYKGIYQFINRSFASMIDKKITCINREQDLGDPGLRQAKMSYRPDGFVKKYKIFSDPKFCLCENCNKDLQN